MVMTITSITPRGGASGTGVLVSGTGFEAVEGTLTVDGQTASITSWSDIQITFVVPAGTQTNGNYTLRIVSADLGEFAEEHFWIPAPDPFNDGLDYQYPNTETGPTQNVDLPRRAEAALFNRLLDRVLSGGGAPPAFTVDLALVSASSYELGSSVTNLQFNATYTGGPAVSSTLQDNDGNAPVNVLGLPNPITLVYVYSKSGIGDTILFTLIASDGVAPKQDSVSIRFYPRVFWGVGIPGGSDEAFIEALSNSALAGSRNRTFTVSPAVGEKIYYAYPESYGDATFQVGPFPGGFLPATIISVTNPYGITMDYRLYESTVTGLGTSTVIVT